MILHRDDHRDPRHTGTGSPAPAAPDSLPASRSPSWTDWAGPGPELWAQQPGAHLDTQYSISMNLWTRMALLMLSMANIVIYNRGWQAVNLLRHQSTINYFHFSHFTTRSAIYLLQWIVVLSCGTSWKQWHCTCQPWCWHHATCEHLTGWTSCEYCSAGDQVPVEGLGAAGCMLQWPWQ